MNPLIQALRKTGAVCAHCGDGLAYAKEPDNDCNRCGDLHRLLDALAPSAVRAIVDAAGANAVLELLEAVDAADQADVPIGDSIEVADALLVLRRMYKKPSSTLPVDDALEDPSPLETPSSNHQVPTRDRWK